MFYDNIIIDLWSDIMWDVLLDSLIDVLKIIPFLFVAFLILEYIEHKMSKKNEKLLVNNKKYGPIIGGVLGSFPQCGFSAMVTKLFSSRVVTLGTLIAVYLSTSDEMLPILISHGTSFAMILKIIGIKVVIGIIIGIIIDLFYKKKESHKEHIHEECEDEHCHCEKGIFISSLHHTISITVYLLITILILNTIVYYVGEDTIKEFMLNNRAYYISSLIGLIPNCASSVIMTEYTAAQEEFILILFRQFLEFFLCSSVFWHSRQDCCCVYMCKLLCKRTQWECNKC